MFPPVFNTPTVYALTMPATVEKKRIRKAKEQARLKNKRGKVLTGRKLKEREKQLKKSEKKASKKGGISATNQ